MQEVNKYYCNLSYDFYKSYYDIKGFRTILETRKTYYTHHLRFLGIFNPPEKDLLNEFFVEIFSWTVMDKSIMDKIRQDILNNYTLKLQDITVVDPCSGNSFHTFLFNKYLMMPVITVDIQPEENAWIDTIEGDGVSYITNMENHANKILFLSWIDRTNNELPYNLLINYKGNMVISVGNYRETDCKKYLDELNATYRLVSEYYVIMPWLNIEEIKVYVKK
jgi:hypothetical protein